MMGQLAIDLASYLDENCCNMRTCNDRDGIWFCLWVC
jgi:hypothetical protein